MWARSRWCHSAAGSSRSRASRASPISSDHVWRRRGVESVRGIWLSLPLFAGDGGYYVEVRSPPVRLSWLAPSLARRASSPNRSGAWKGVRDDTRRDPASTTGRASSNEPLHLAAHPFPVHSRRTSDGRARARADLCILAGPRPDVHGAIDALRHLT